jgi:Na+-translocating ferredoxin:NAD+ oxidoreductase RnfG subunit
MNMVTPAIDKLVDGNQIKNQVQIRRKVIITSAVVLLAAFGVGMTLDPVEASAKPAPSADTQTDTSEPAGMALEDFSANNAACRVWSNTDTAALVYHCQAKGYEGTNEATITLNKDEGTVTSIEVTAFKDTAGVGDKATAAEELARYEGATINSSIDATSGATFTSSSLRAMAAKALNMAAGN